MAYYCSIKLSCNECFKCRSFSCEGFKVTGKNVAEFGKAVKTYWWINMERHGLPDPTTEARWRVWRLKPCEQLMQHHSLLMESVEYGGSFTLELKNGPEKSVILATRPNVENKNLCTFGEITASALFIFVKALECFGKFGEYHYISNNCRTYCKVYEF